MLSDLENRLNRSTGHISFTSGLQFGIIEFLNDYKFIKSRTY